MDNSQQCTTCFFTKEFPGIEIGENGQCNLCSFSQAAPPPASRASRDIAELLRISDDLKSRNGRYDCIIGASGGLDSSYVIYVAKKVLRLNPLVVYYNHGLTHEIADRNLVSLCQDLDIELRTFRSKDHYDQKYVQSIIKAFRDTDFYWGVCFFCHYILAAVLYRTALQENISTVLTSTNYYEAKVDVPTRFRFEVIGKSLRKRGVLNLIKTLFHLIVAFSNLTLLKLKYYLPPITNLFRRAPNKPTNLDTVIITPYLGLDIPTMVATLESETGWRSPQPPQLPMRFDCMIEDSLINRTYQKATGITVHGIICNHMIYAGLGTKDELSATVTHSKEMIECEMSTVYDILGLPRNG